MCFEHEPLDASHWTPVAPVARETRLTAPMPTCSQASLESGGMQREAAILPNPASSMAFELMSSDCSVWLSRRASAMSVACLDSNSHLPSYHHTASDCIFGQAWACRDKGTHPDRLSFTRRLLVFSASYSLSSPPLLGFPASDRSVHKREDKSKKALKFRCTTREFNITSQV